MSDLKISVSIDANGTKSGADEAKRAVRGVGEEAKKTSVTYTDASGKMRDANGRFVKSADDAKRSVTSLAKVDFSGAIRQIKEYGDRIKDVGSQISSVGQSLSISLTAPILALALIIGGLGTTYESSLNTFQAVTKATSEEMRQASKVAKDLGADVTLPATSAKDAALAMSELGKAGFTAAQSMAAAKGVLQLAAAGQLEEAKAAEIAGNALNSFSLKAEEATRVADLLAAASNASSAEVTDVAESFSQASATFAAAKVPIEDLTTAIAIMANAGIKGSDAGTSLKTFLSSLQAPSDAGADALQNLGIEVFDLQGRMKSLPDVIGQFEKSLAGLTDEKKVQAIQAIFGSDASRAAQILFRDGEAGFQKIKEAVTLTGAAADLAAAKTKGVGGAFESLKSQAETIGITIFDALKGPAEQGLRTLAESLGKVSDYLSKLGETNPQIIQIAAVILAVVAAVGPLLIGLGALVSFIGSIATGIGALIPIFAAVGGAFASFGGFIVSFVGLIGQAGLVASFSALATVLGGTVSAAIGTFLTALAPMAAGVAAVVAVVGTLIAVGVALFAAYQTNFGGLKDLVDDVFNSIVGTVQGGLQAIQNFWTTYGAFIISTATGIFNSIVEFIRPAVTEIVGFFREMWTTIIEVSGPLLTQIVAYVKNQISAMATVVAVVLVNIAEFWKTHGEQIKAIVFAVWTILKTIVLTGIRQIANVITLVLAVINGDWAAAWNALKNIVQTGVNASITILKAFGSLVINALAFVATKLYEIGKNIIQGLINGIKSGAAALYETATGLANSVIGIFRDVPEVRSPSRVTTEIGEFITEGLAIGIQNKESLAVSAAKKVASEVVKAFRDAQKEFSKLAGASPETIQTIQQTTQTSDATSAQQEIIKLRGELGERSGSPLPSSVGGTQAELQYLQRLKTAADEFNKSLEAMGDISKETAEFNEKAALEFADKLEKMRQDGALETIRLQQELELLGVIDAGERRRIENLYEVKILREQMANDGYLDGDIDAAVEVLRVEQSRKRELQEILDLRKQINAAGDFGENLTGQLDSLRNGGRELSEYEKTLRKINAEFKNIPQAQKDYLLGVAQQIDAQKAFNEQYEKTYDFIRDSLDVLTDSTKTVGERLKSFFGGIFQSFKKMLLDMAAEWLTSKLLKVFNPNGGASSSGGGNFFSNILGGIKNLFSGGSSSSSGSSAGGGGNVFSNLLGGIRNLFSRGGSGLTPDKLTNIGNVTNGRGDTFSSGSGSGLAGGIALGGAAANIVGGLIGGRVGGFISGAGSGAAMGAKIGSLFGPGPGTAIGAGIGALAGGLMSLFGGDPKRKADKKENLPKLQKVFTDSFAELRDVLAKLQTRPKPSIAPDDAISRATEALSAIQSGGGVKFESKKYQKESAALIKSRTAEATSLMAAITQQAAIARSIFDEQANVKSKLVAEFASGSFIGRRVIDDQLRDMRFARRNGMLGGTFTGKDTLPSMLALGEMVLNPAQIQNVILNAGIDPFKNAGIPGYAEGNYVAPSFSPPSPQPRAERFDDSARSNNTIVIENITIELEAHGITEAKVKEISIDGLNSDKGQRVLAKNIKILQKERELR